VPLEEAIDTLRAELGKGGEIGGVYADISLDEARAMGDLTADDWCLKSRAARAHKIATVMIERRIDYYYILKSELEMKNREKAK
jgi:hypothetical protein